MASKSGKKSLSSSQRRIVDRFVREAELSGVSLIDGSAEKNQLNKNMQRISELEIKFGNNVLDTTKSWMVLLTEAEEVAGLPQSAKAYMAQQAKGKLALPAKDADEKAVKARKTAFGNCRMWNEDKSLTKLTEEFSEAVDFSAATAETGPWLVTLDIPSIAPVLQHSQDRKLREEVWKAYITRASEFSPKLNSGATKKISNKIQSPGNKTDSDSSSPDNTPVMLEILKIKTENAKLLGYGNHAEVSLAQKMATLETAQKLISDLKKASYEPAKKEIEEIREFAKTYKISTQSDSNSSTSSLSSDSDLSCSDMKQWDLPFYREKWKEQLYSYKAEDLKPYFSLPKVQEGLFSLAIKLFGVDINELTDKSLLEKMNISFWHEDVRIYEIKREGQTVSYFYLDPYARPETKQGGAWMMAVAGRTENELLVSDSNSTPFVRLPVAHMVCNQSPPIINTKDPSKSQPSLMTIREVETLFHEFGHALQHMLTTETEGLSAGISGVEWDAVEQPSQFMENWVYHKPTIDGLALHYETGETIPIELWEKVVKAKNYRAGTDMLGNLHLSAIDLELHSKFTEAPSDSNESLEACLKNPHLFWDFDQEFAEDYALLPPYPHDRFLCNFRHIFAGGYSAGYYSYKWAEVLSADCFGAFEEAMGAEKSDEEVDKLLQETGRRFAATILGQGGGDPLEVFKKFRGRKPSIDALLRHSGLAL